MAPGFARMATRPGRVERDPDLLVIGGGAGGLSAARAGVGRGARSVLVQNGPLGGDCTFTGCVPSKALIEAAGRGRSFADAIAAARRAVEAVAATEDDDVVRREGIDVVHGWATFRSPWEVEVDGTLLHPGQVVVATGGRPAVPPIPGLDELDYLTNENVFDLDAAPASLAVLGGGAVGCELAQAFGRLGVTVTILEGLERLLPREEPDASEVITAVFHREGIEVRTGSNVERVEPLERKGAARLHLRGGATVEADRVLVAVGRTGAIEGLGLDAAGVATDRGFIVTNDTLATTVKGVWAVGDVAGKLQFTHAADEMGRIAVANALGRLPDRKFRAGWVPWVTFTAPEVARVGITESEGADVGARVAYLPMTEVDRAIAAAATDGFVKLVAGPRPLLRNTGGGRLLGATIVADRGGELVAEAALALRTGMFVGRLAQTVHAYPTWSTAMRQAAGQFFTEVGGRRAHPAQGQHSA